MRSILLMVDEFLRGRARFDANVPVAGRVKWLLAFTAIFGTLYGAAMGSFGFCASGEARLLAYSIIVAVKVPVLLLVTFALCLPSFFVVNTVFGLREDFAEALRAVLGTLACVAIVLSALAPVTLFFYFCTNYYDAAILFNGLIFFVASLASLRVVGRYYGPLIQRSARHKTMMFLWFGLYIFVAIQMAWTLRPFIGDPNPEVPIVLFRSTDVDNAYLEIARLVRQVMRMWFA